MSNWFKNQENQFLLAMIMLVLTISYLYKDL